MASSFSSGFEIILLDTPSHMQPYKIKILISSNISHYLLNTEASERVNSSYRQLVYYLKTFFMVQALVFQMQNFEGSQCQQQLLVEHFVKYLDQCFHTDLCDQSNHQDQALHNYCSFLHAHS